MSKVHPPPLSITVCSYLLFCFFGGVLFPPNESRAIAFLLTSSEQYSVTQYRVKCGKWNRSKTVWLLRVSRALIRTRGGEKKKKRKKLALLFLKTFLAVSFQTCTNDFWVLLQDEAGVITCYSGNLGGCDGDNEKSVICGIHKWCHEAYCHCLGVVYSHY